MRSLSLSFFLNLRISFWVAIGIPFSFAGMFILLILVFRSYIQALLIFGLIPFGVIGAFWGHGIQGVQVNTLSVYGILALAGIIVNGSIVLVVKINRNLKSGMLLSMMQVFFDCVPFCSRHSQRLLVWLPSFSRPVDRLSF